MRDALINSGKGRLVGPERKSAVNLLSDLDRIAGNRASSDDAAAEQRKAEINQLRGAAVAGGAEAASSGGYEKPPSMPTAPDPVEREGPEAYMQCRADWRKEMDAYNEKYSAEARER